VLRFSAEKWGSGILDGMSEHFLSIAEVADRAHLSVNTVRSYVRKGLLPAHAVTVGRAKGYRQDVIDEWIQNRTPY
jgi:predicted DNA-binding transcriptional regulator AlpA